MNESESQDIIEIKKVRRQAGKIVGVLAGETGTGKTRSALELALGLADNRPDKVALLDTENGRGSFYDDVYGPNDEDRFLIADLCPPFSPDRYIKAMRQFAREGIDVLIIDSGSHEWEGEGGCEEIANKKPGRPDWLSAKREHKRFINSMLYLPFHIILCLRAREKMDFKNTGPKGEPTPLGVQPICEKNLMFEATFSFMMQDQGKSRKEIKLPDCLRPMLDHTGYLTSADGKRLRDWIGGANSEDRHKNQLTLAASRGMEALADVWSGIPKNERPKYQKLKDSLKTVAERADKENAIPDNGAPEQEEEWR